VIEALLLLLAWIFVLVRWLLGGRGYD